jgi:hypothetical protein
MQTNDGLDTEIKDFLCTATEAIMPDTPRTDEKKKVDGWNLRPFDRDLRIACQIQARKEDMYDYEWVQKILREALGLPR